MLADGEQTYVYGLKTFKQGGRTVISQVSETQTGYYLPDVMGSVRQMTSSEGDLQLAQSYSPYGEELEEIGSEPATFGYAGQLYDEQTGLLFLRARYYSPSTGRFISHDSWAGDANMPMSYNMWLYGYGNPMRYTDPSGNVALIDTLFAGVVGAAAGVLVGATIGTCTYDKALTGQCGCDWKQKAFSMTRQQWSKEFMIGGAILGALFGAATTLPSITLTGGALIAAGITKIAIGGFTIAISLPRVIDAYHRIEEVGANWCTIGRFLSEVFVLVGGIALVASGFIDVAKGTSQVIAAASSTTGSAAVKKPFTRGLKNVDELDPASFNNLTDNGIIQVNRSGGNRPQYSDPNSYYTTPSGKHVIIYDEEGKLIYDISVERVKAFQINPNRTTGVEYFREYKLDGIVPNFIKNIFGW